MTHGADLPTKMAEYAYVVSVRIIQQFLQTTSDVQAPPFICTTWSSWVRRWRLLTPGEKMGHLNIQNNVGCSEIIWNRMGFSKVSSTLPVM